jgi:hypothetical protein
VAQKILCQFQVAGPVVNQTGGRLPECVIARRTLRPGNIQAAENPAKNFFSRNVLIEEIPIRFAENEVG